MSQLLDESQATEGAAKRKKPHIKAPTTAEVLAAFDGLPDEARIRLPVMCGLLGCSPSSVYRLVEKGTLPAPAHVFGRVSTWTAGQARAALKSVGGE